MARPFASVTAPTVSNARVPVATAIVKGVVKEYAERIRNHVIADMNAPKSGRVTEKPDGSPHIASAPGEAPAVWSGKLQDSLRIRYRMGGLMADIGVLSGLPPYGHMHEEGDGVPARPFMAPALEAETKDFGLSVRTALLGIR